MVYTGRAIKHNNHLRIDDPAFQTYKESIGEGQSVPVIFGEERRKDAAQNLIYELIDRYWKAAGLNKIEAKYEIKFRHGVYLPFGPGFAPPKWRGAFVEMYGQFYFFKSFNEYTKSEMLVATDGAKHDVVEAGGTVEDLEDK